MEPGSDDRQRPIRILFLCTANSARSQMAEALLRSLGQGRFAVASAGTAPATELHPLAVQVMREAGLPLTGHYPKSIDSINDLELPWDYVITTCDDANEACPTFPDDPLRIHWRFDDPARAQGTLAEREHSFRLVRDEIRQRVSLFVGLRRHQDWIAATPGELA